MAEKILPFKTKWSDQHYIKRLKGNRLKLMTLFVRNYPTDHFLYILVFQFNIDK